MSYQFQLDQQAEQDNEQLQDMLSGTNSELCQLSELLACKMEN